VRPDVQGQRAVCGPPEQPAAFGGDGPERGGEEGGGGGGAGAVGVVGEEAAGGGGGEGEGGVGVEGEVGGEEGGDGEGEGGEEGEEEGEEEEGEGGWGGWGDGGGAGGGGEGGNHLLMGWGRSLGGAVWSGAAGDFMEACVAGSWFACLHVKRYCCSEESITKYRFRPPGVYPSCPVLSFSENSCFDS